MPVPVLIPVGRTDAPPTTSKAEILGLETVTRTWTVDAAAIAEAATDAAGSIARMVERALAEQGLGLGAELNAPLHLLVRIDTPKGR